MFSRQRHCRRELALETDFIGIDFFRAGSLVGAAGSSCGVRIETPDLYRGVKLA